ncbi:MAG: T9SS type A sorting domain-containing protein [Bacteroidetes bacterium]|nr:T9SS type A sorting domain-containing protein [Bacteroidota bacterium]
MKIIIAMIFVLTAFTRQYINAQNFQPYVQNPFGIESTEGYSAPAFGDLDGDGDLDMMAGTLYGSLYYYQNTGTANSPAFAGSLQNPFGLIGTEGYSSPVFVDLDGDGDLDLMVGKMYGGFEYYKNTGTPTAPNFELPISSPFGLLGTDGFSAPAFGDLDGDGDLDMVSGNLYGQLLYFENTGTVHSPYFELPVNPAFGLTSIDGYSAPTIGDLDKDGDLDVLSGGLYGGLFYFQNTGTAHSPNFTTVVQNPFGLTSTDGYSSPAFGDLDKDGDLDVMAGTLYGSFYYYKNLDMTGITDGSYGQLTALIYPNPCKEFVKIEVPSSWKANNKNYRIRIINVLGQEVFQSEAGTPNTIVDMTNIPDGCYSVIIHDMTGSYAWKLVKAGYIFN